MLGEGVDISREDYENGYTIFGFDLSPALSRGGHQERSEKGSMRLALEFEKPLESTITVLLYCQYDNTITVDQYRNVVKDF